MSGEIITDMQPAELLKKVNEAITAVLIGGQSYRIGTRSLTRADLSMLKALREELIAETQATSSSSLLDNTYVAFFEGPR